MPIALRTRLNNIARQAEAAAKPVAFQAAPPAGASQSAPAKKPGRKPAKKAKA